MASPYDYESDDEEILYDAVKETNDLKNFVCYTAQCEFEKNEIDKEMYKQYLKQKKLPLMQKHYRASLMISIFLHTLSQYECGRREAIEKASDYLKEINEELTNLVMFANDMSDNKKDNFNEEAYKRVCDHQKELQNNLSLLLEGYRELEKAEIWRWKVIFDLNLFEEGKKLNFEIDKGLLCYTY